MYKDLKFRIGLGWMEDPMPWHLQDMCLGEKLRRKKACNASDPNVMVCSFRASGLAGQVQTSSAGHDAE